MPCHKLKYTIQISRHFNLKGHPSYIIDSNVTMTMLNGCGVASGWVCACSLSSLTLPFFTSSLAPAGEVVFMLLVSSVSDQAQNTAHCTLRTAHYIQYTAYCTPHTTHWIMNTAHCTLQTEHCSLHTAHCTLQTAHCTLYTAHCTAHSTCALHTPGI